MERVAIIWPGGAGSTSNAARIGALQPFLDDYKFARPHTASATDHPPPASRLWDRWRRAHLLKEPCPESAAGGDRIADRSGVRPLAEASGRQVLGLFRKRVTDEVWAELVAKDHDLLKIVLSDLAAAMLVNMEQEAAGASNVRLTTYAVPLLKTLRRQIGSQPNPTSPEANHAFRSLRTAASEAIGLARQVHWYAEAVAGGAGKRAAQPGLAGGPARFRLTQNETFVGQLIPIAMAALDEASAFLERSKPADTS